MTDLLRAYKKAAYEQAVNLRKRGFTYTEIAKICAVSRGTVSNWLAKEPFSQQVATSNRHRAAEENRTRMAAVNKARRNERLMQHSAIVKLADTEYKHYRHSPLFVAGITLYSAHGDQKMVRPMRIATKDSLQHLIFINFVVEFLGVERSSVRCALFLYPEHDEGKALRYWSRQLKVSIANFHRSQVVKNRSQKPPLHFGVGNTIIGSTLLKQKLMRWQELLLKELKN